MFPVVFHKDYIFVQKGFEFPNTLRVRFSIHSELLDDDLQFFEEIILRVYLGGCGVSKRVI
jgi:hypothetical protein